MADTSNGLGLSESEAVAMCAINYWCRHKYYNKVQTVAQEAAAADGAPSTSHGPVTPSLPPTVGKFWASFSLLMQGQLPNARRGLEAVIELNDPLTRLCARLALIHAHKQEKTRDQQRIEDLEREAKLEYKSCTEDGLYQASLFYWHVGKNDRARDFVDRTIKLADKTANAKPPRSMALRGWIDLTSSRENQAKNSQKYFHHVLKNTPANSKPHCEALLGMAQHMQTQKNDVDSALETIDKAVVSYQGFLPVLLEKAKMQLAAQTWDDAVDTANRALDIEPHCIEAKRIILLNTLARRGRYSEAEQELGELIAAIDKYEPKNHYVYFSVSQPCARLAGMSGIHGDHVQVLRQTVHLIESALKTDPKNSTYVAELGYQQLLLGNETEAHALYRKAMEEDEGSVTAMHGAIKCQLLENHLEEAAQQLEFLVQIESSIGKSAELLFLSALLAAKQQKSADCVVGQLDEAFDTHQNILANMPRGLDFYTAMAPDFMLGLVYLYLQFSPTDPCLPGDQVSPVLQKCTVVLEYLVQAAPGMLEATYLMAKVKYLSGLTDHAQASLNYCLKHDATYSEAHLLMAEIHLGQGNVQQAMGSLEIGLSYNIPGMKLSVTYHLIKARVIQAEGDDKLPEALRTLELAMKLPGIKVELDTAGSKARGQRAVTTGERVSVFLELAAVHWKMGNQPEATKVMQDALTAFADTPEESRVIIANADLSLQRGDIDGAIRMLQSVGESATYYIQSKEKMAYIYLHHRNDKRMFAACYKELVKRNPTGHTCLLLGDAYMSIQEPEKAISIYKEAYKKNPNDAVLASKIGHAMVKTHNYSKAISFYKISIEGQPQLRADLAELHLKVKDFDEANRILEEAVQEAEQIGNNNIGDLSNMVKYRMLLAKAKREEGSQGAMPHLLMAKKLQLQLISRLGTENPGAINDAKKSAANICYQIGEHNEQVLKDNRKAENYYKESLQHDEKDSRAMLALSRLFMKEGDLEACKFYCIKLLRIEPKNNDAAMMMGDLMFMKNEFENANFHYQALLEREPNHYQALAQMIDILRRTGRLKDVPTCIEAAEQATAVPENEPGLNYCKGVYHRHMHDPNTAIKFLNKARNDSDCGTEANFKILEIVLNPKNAIIGESIEDNMEDGENEEMLDRTAHSLLEQVPESLRGESGSRYDILSILAEMNSKSRQDIENAQQKLTQILAHNKSHVPAMLAFAKSYYYQKKSLNPSTRNFLKKIAKQYWSIEDGEEFEQAWLALAKNYIDSNKYDQAEMILDKCISKNKSCTKAHELMGEIKEWEKSYADAADEYQQAWDIVGAKRPEIGYKLAFNYLKAKRNLDAISICHEVLKADPDYKGIKKEILLKARDNLRGKDGLKGRGGLLVCVHKCQTADRTPDIPRSLLNMGREKKVPTTGSPRKKANMA
eukprot:UC4_evm1s735